MADESRDHPAMQPIETVSDLALIAGHLRPKTVIIPGGDRPDDLRLVDSARDHGIVERCILVGDGAAIRHAAHEIGIEVPDADIVATESQEETAARTIELVQQGGVDIILKGNISTPILNRAMMRIVVRNTISLVTLFDTAPVAGGRPMLLTDPGVTTVCSFGRMVGLIENAVDVARSIMGTEWPKVAVLSANEKVIDSLPSTRMGRALAERHWDDCIVYGPLSFDLAVDPESVGLKGLPDYANAQEVAGQADILVCPCIDSANVLYKMIMQNVEYGMGTFAGITVGVAVPYVILSRADNIETKVQSIAFGSLAAERMHMGKREAPSGRAIVPSFSQTYRVLVVNPGASSTKVALFENARCVRVHEVAHASLPPSAELAADATRREATVRAFLAGHDVGQVDAVVGRGGFLPRPEEKLAAGTYVIDDAMIEAITTRAERRHAANLGIPMAAALAHELGVPAFVVDPVIVDEMVPEAELSGYAPIKRKSVAHVLSVRTAAQRTAHKMGSHIDQTNYVVAHMGSGITVAAVRAGRITDNTIALLGEGPFTPQRAGALPQRDLIDLCYSGQFTRDELIRELTTRGGLRSYLGEDRMEVIEPRIADGDEEAARVVDAMVYQIAKSIGAMCVAAGPDAEAIILTGGLARSALVVRGLKKRLAHLLPVFVLKDTPEMEAMALGACRVLSGDEEAKQYRPPQ